MTHVQMRVRRGLSVLARSAVPWVTAAVLGGMMVARGDGLDPLTFLLALALAWCVSSVWAPSPLVGRRSAPGLHDEIDRETGVGNARAALASIERERSRAASHGSLFSVVVLDVGRDTLAGLPPRHGTRILGGLLRGIADDVRSSDRVCRVRTSDREQIVIVLPDTGASGARLFTNRLVPHVRQRLVDESGRSVDQALRAEVVTAPDDGVAVERLQRRLQVIVGTEELVLGGGARRRRGPRAAQRSSRSHAGADPRRSRAASVRPESGSPVSVADGDDR